MTTLKVTMAGRMMVDGEEMDCVVLQGDIEAIRAACAYLADDVVLVRATEAEEDRKDYR